MNEYFIKEIAAIYQKGNLIPFIGSGLSIPFSIPDWSNLIREYAKQFNIPQISLQQLVEIDLAKNDFWEALKVIKKYANRTDQDIQEFICKIITSKINYNIGNDYHNYSDLTRMNFDIYLTTNYDHILYKYISSHYVPINLIDINNNTQQILSDEGKRIYHLHGNISKPDSIVITEETYLKLYNDKKYDKLFSLFAGSKTFLFIGLSFNDIFIKRIINDVNEFFHTKHYIILNKPSDEQIRTLKERYNIETLSYDSQNSTHAIEIRKILSSISNTIINENDDLAVEFMELLLERLPDSNEKQILEESLFCKKLRLEEINETLVDYSKNCFFTAEQYIRWLNKSKITRKDEIIRYLLDISYVKYQGLLIQVFQQFKNCEEFLNSVHQALDKMDCTKLEKIINKENLPSEINKQGFVHIIANENAHTEKEVWWGEKRL